MDLENRDTYFFNFLKNYIQSFEIISDTQNNNFQIKKEHSIRVVKIIENLGRTINLTPQELEIAKLIALFHDIGRFSQYIEYKTFDDTKSVDHAERSVHVLKEKNLLNIYNEETQSIIFTAIIWHNKQNLPKQLKDKELLFSKLIRDADKLDIFRVVTDYYENRNKKPNHTLTWEMPDNNIISEKIFKTVQSNKIILKEWVKSQLDVKVLQMSWIFDLNFKQSFYWLAKERYIDRIYNSMPKTDNVIEIYRIIKNYLENKIFN